MPIQSIYYSYNAQTASIYKENSRIKLQGRNENGVELKENL